MLKWAKEIIRYIPVCSQFVIYGNVYDIYPFKQEDRYVPYELEKFIGELLKREAGFSTVLSYEPLVGYKVIVGSQDDLEKIGIDNIKEITLTGVSKHLEDIVNNKENKCAVIINFASRLSFITHQEYDNFMYNSFKLCLSAQTHGIPAMYNPIFFIYERDTDPPPWYYFNNNLIRLISIPKPDVDVRKYLAFALLPIIDGWQDLPDDTKNNITNDFVDQTTGLFSREVVSIIKLAKFDNLNAREINEAIRRYRVGVVENPWAKLNKDKLLNAEKHLSKRVIGQEKAVYKAGGILRRSFYNLSGSQFSKYTTRPKGVLFLAGPTGVGKTELAKAIAELIFGSENSYIRFDMSEFSHEHTDQRLIGAPPGYVGYEQGGELVNAIKQNPFSVILFDEIEKANPKILDIFLQILDDGRITSGRGETVYLSESIIIFTSNLGVYDITPDGKKVMRVEPGDPYGKIEASIIEAIEDYFKYKLGRPEILNRIGSNVVVFDFIRSETAEGILNKMLKNITFKLKEEHGIDIILRDKAFNVIKEECLKDLSMGGRGIGNKLEDVLVTPLADFLFMSYPSNGSKVEIEDIIEENYKWVLQGKVISG